MGIHSMVVPRLYFMAQPWNVYPSLFGLSDEREVVYVWVVKSEGGRGGRLKDPPSIFKAMLPIE